MSTLSGFHPFFGNGVFSTDGVMELIKKGDITWEDLGEEQIQPNTIDVRIGRTKVYDGHVEKVYSGEKDEPIVIPSRGWAEIEIYDKIGFDVSKYMMDIELRSGRGRLLLLPGNGMDLVNLMGMNGMGVFNMNPNDVVLYGQDRFAQVFFNSLNGTPADGQVIGDPEEVAAIAEICGVERLGPYLKFSPGNKVLRYRNIGRIDTRRDYAHDELFEECDLPYRLGACEQVLMQSKEVVDVPGDIGVRILRRMPTSQRSYMTGPDIEAFEPLRFIVNSGWIDSGYKGKITMQPLASLECVLGETNPVCLAIVYKYDKDVRKPYDGHYGGEQGRVLNS